MSPTPPHKTRQEHTREKEIQNISPPAPYIISLAIVGHNVSIWLRGGPSPQVRSPLLGGLGVSQTLTQPLEDAIRLHFIPSITGRDSMRDAESDLFALPARLGGLALPNPLHQLLRIFHICKHHSPSCLLYIVTVHGPSSLHPC